MKIYNESPVLKIRSLYETLHIKEKKIADVILTDPNKVVYLSVKEMAQKCGTAESSIVRFCKLLGYSGYSELKLEIAKSAFETDSLEHRQEPDTDISLNSTEGLTRRLFHDTAELFNRLPALMDCSALEAAAHAVAGAELLFVYGYIYSGQIAYVFHERMKALGIPTFLAWDHISMKQNSRLAGSGSVSLFISHSGASKDSVGNAKQAKENGSRLIVLTTDASSPLARLADIPLIITLPSNSVFEYYYPAELAFQAVLAAVSASAAIQKNSGPSREKTDRYTLEILRDAIMPH